MLTCPKCGFANAEGGRFCSNCGSPLEAARALDGERRFATVLFADVARSTAIAEQLDPEDWAVVMNGAFGFINAAITRYGGTVSRLMGDAVLALFGAPVAHEDDAERAVRSGLEIQSAAMAYARSVRERYGFDFDLRVGINTGTAVLAFVGDAVKTEYTAMGDAANVAARLQSAALPGTVLISADTYRLVHTLVDVDPRGAIEMKGKQEPVECYVVTGLKAVPQNPRGLEGLVSPMVGRDPQIATLRKRLLDLKAGKGAVVAVVGEAGLGKSRLIAELRRARSEVPGIVWLEGRAISFGQSVPYYPWRQLGRRMIGATEMDAPAAVRDKLRAFVAELSVRREDMPFYEVMLAVDDETSRFALSSMSGEAVVNGVAAAVVGALKGSIHLAGARHPHVLVMDDLHWSDTATLELIAQVATLGSFEPLLVICVLRPDRKAPSWQLLDRLAASLGEAFTRIDLEPLPESASSELLANLLTIEDLPAAIRAQILQRAEGNPFYLEEVLRTLIDDGQVVQDSGHWRATKSILEAKIPDTLAGVLSARIDRLPDATKRVAQTASVIGRVFMHRVLETVCHDGPAAERIEHVEPHIATLSYEQLVRERAREPEREYVFKHALTAEAAYELLLKSRRRELHARTGLALEALFNDRRDEFAAMLGHHFWEAEDYERALGYSLRAALNARRVFAPQEELEHRERMVLCLDRLPNALPATRIDAIVEWAQVRHRLNMYDGVLPRLESAVALARAQGDKARLAHALAWNGNIHMVTGYPSRSGPYLAEAGVLADEVGNTQLLLLPLFLSTWSMVDRDPAAASKILAEIVDQTRNDNVADIHSHALAYRALAVARLGDFQLARTLVEEALAAAPKSISRVKEADTHIGAALVYYEIGEVEKGLEHARLGAQLAHDANGIECACAGYFYLGKGEFELRRLQDALLDYGKSLDLAKLQGWDAFEGMVRAEVAVTELEQGAPDAIERVRTALSNAQAQHEDYYAANLGQQLARGLARAGRNAEAASLIEASLAYFRQRNMRPALAAALEVAGDIRAANGEAATAAAARAEATSLRLSLQSTLTPVEP